jgi:hypothetical protein
VRVRCAPFKRREFFRLRLSSSSSLTLHLS